MLFWDHTEDYSLGDSLSDSSEELLPRGKEGATIYRNICQKKKTHTHTKNI